MPTTTTRRDDIFEAAADLFRTKGFAATSMRDLARAVNLNASSLYNHIESKEQILQDICFATARKFEQGMQEIERLNVSSLDKVRALIQQHIQIATSDRTSITAFNDEWRHLSEPFLSEFVAMRKDYESKFRTIIQQGIEEGEIRSAPVSLLLYTLLSSVRWLYDWFEHGRNLSVSDLEQEMIAILFNGLRPESERT